MLFWHFHSLQCVCVSIRGDLDLKFAYFLVGAE